MPGILPSTSQPSFSSWKSTKIRKNYKKLNDSIDRNCHIKEKERNEGVQRKNESRSRRRNQARKRDTQQRHRHPLKISSSRPTRDVIHTVRISILGLAGITIKGKPGAPEPQRLAAVIAFARKTSICGISAPSHPLEKSPKQSTLVFSDPPPETSRFVAIWDDNCIVFETELTHSLPTDDCSATSSRFTPKSFEITLALIKENVAHPLGFATLAISGEESGDGLPKVIDLKLLSMEQAKPLGGPVLKIANDIYDATLENKSRKGTEKEKENDDCPKVKKKRSGLMSLFKRKTKTIEKKAARKSERSTLPLQEESQSFNDTYGIESTDAILRVSLEVCEVGTNIEKILKGKSGNMIHDEKGKTQRRRNSEIKSLRDRIGESSSVDTTFVQDSCSSPDKALADETSDTESLEYDTLGTESTHFTEDETTQFDSLEETKSTTLASTSASDTYRTTTIESCTPSTNSKYVVSDRIHQIGAFFDGLVLGCTSNHTDQIEDETYSRGETNPSILERNDVGGSKLRKRTKERMQRRGQGASPMSSFESVSKEFMSDCDTSKQTTVRIPSTPKSVALFFDDQEFEPCDKKLLSVEPKDPLGKIANALQCSNEYGDISRNLNYNISYEHPTRMPTFIHQTIDEKSIGELTEVTGDFDQVENMGGRLLPVAFGGHGLCNMNSCSRRSGRRKIRTIESNERSDIKSLNGIVLGDYFETYTDELQLSQCQSDSIEMSYNDEKFRNQRMAVTSSDESSHLARVVDKYAINV